MALIALPVLRMVLRECRAVRAIVASVPLISTTPRPASGEVVAQQGPRPAAFSNSASTLIVEGTSTGDRGAGIRADPADEVLPDVVAVRSMRRIDGWAGFTGNRA